MEEKKQSEITARDVQALIDQMSDAGEAQARVHSYLIHGPDGGKDIEFRFPELVTYKGKLPPWEIQILQAKVALLSAEERTRLIEKTISAYAWDHPLPNVSCLDEVVNQPMSLATRGFHILWTALYHLRVTVSNSIKFGGLKRAPPRVKIARPPGQLVERFAERFLPVKACKAVKEQIADMREEYCEELSAGHLWRARWIHGVYYVAKVRRLIGLSWSVIVKSVKAVFGAGQAS